jgi:hypothetical protein
MLSLNLCVHLHTTTQLSCSRQALQIKSPLCLNTSQWPLLWNQKNEIRYSRSGTIHIVSKYNFVGICRLIKNIIIWYLSALQLYSCTGIEHPSEMRGRPAGRFLGGMTTPTRPRESLLQFLVGIFSQNFTLRVSRVRLLKYEHQYFQYPRVTIKFLMFECCWP